MTKWRFWEKLHFLQILAFYTKSPFSQKLNITTLYSENWTFFKTHEIEYTSSTMFKKTLYWWNWISSFPYVWGKTPIWIECNLISIPTKCLSSGVAYQPPPRLSVLAGKINHSFFHFSTLKKYISVHKLRFSTYLKLCQVSCSRRVTLLATTWKLGSERISLRRQQLRDAMTLSNTCSKKDAT